MLVAGVGHTQVCAYPPVAAQLGLQPLGHRVEDLLSKVDDFFRALLSVERLGSIAIGVDFESVQ